MSWVKHHNSSVLGYFYLDFIELKVLVMAN